jgi:dephospho-CoA kinase
MSPSHPPEEPSLRGRWKHGAIPVVGLIGGIGSGKSRVASLLAERGAAVIDADAVGHELLGDPEICAKVVERFGMGVLQEPREAGTAPPKIDRRALGAIVFADPASRQALEALLHPAMRAQFLATIDRLAQRRESTCIVLDAAILLEAGWDDLCDRIVFVDAPHRQRLRRVAEARGWSEPTLEARERAQWPLDEKRRRADGIISNDSGPDRLEDQVDRLVSRLLGPPAPSEESPPPRTEPRAGLAGEAMPARLALNVHTPLGGRS